MSDESSAWAVGDTVDGLAVDTFSGGVVVDLAGTRALLPTEFVGALGRVHPSSAVGRRLKVEILALDTEAASTGDSPSDSKRPPIVSERHVLDRARMARARQRDPCRVGNSVTGTVVHVAPHTITVDIDGFRGTLRVADVDVEASRVATHGTQLFAVSDRAEVTITGVDSNTATCTLCAKAPTSASAPRWSDLQSTAVATLRHLLGPNADGLSVETTAWLRSSPALLGVLAGATATVQIPAPHVAEVPSVLETDLAFLAHRLRLVCGYGFALTLVPTESPTLMFTNVTVLNTLPEARDILRPLSRFRDIWCGRQFMSDSGPRRAAEFFNAVGAETADRLWRALLAPQWQAPAQELAAPTLGLLAQVTTRTDVTGVFESIEAWERNAIMFGHRGVDVRLFVQGEQEQINALTSEVRRWAQTARALTVSIDASASAKTTSFESPVVVRRNAALAKLPKPALLTECGTTPQARTFDRETLRRVYLAGGKMPPGTVPGATDCPIDLLGVCIRTAAATVGSPVTTGLQHPWPDDQAAAIWNVGRGEAASGANRADTVVMDLARGLDVIEQAVYCGSAALTPFQPAVNDGDEISVSTLDALGRAPAAIPAALCRSQAPSSSAYTQDVGLAASLLAEATLSQLVWRWVRAALSVSPDEGWRTEHIIEALNSIDSWSRESLIRLWGPRLEETVASAARGAAVSSEATAALEEHFGVRALRTPASLAESMRPKVAAVMEGYGRLLIEWS